MDQSKERDKKPHLESDEVMLISQTLNFCSMHRDAHFWGGGREDRELIIELCKAQNSERTFRQNKEKEPKEKSRGKNKIQRVITQTHTMFQNI